MRIAVDAMGGDHAPLEIIKGALEALKENTDLHIALVGREEDIKKHLPTGAYSGRIEVINSREVITMDEHPATAYRKKKDASITVAAKLVKEKKAEALISAGSTGAQMVASLFGIGRLKGIDRPAIGTVLPTLTGKMLLLDAGANADCKPENLVQFAQMGNIYSQNILGVAEPRVGLVSIGEEEAKGNELTLQTHELLKQQTKLNFIGNVEGRDILTGKADVIVCDGFVGNTILKVIEGTASTLFTLLKEEIMKSSVSKAGALLMKPGFKNLKAKLDYTEIGGAPLLGIKGISIICHGSSNALAIKNAINVAAECINNEFVKHLQESVE